MKRITVLLAACGFSCSLIAQQNTEESGAYKRILMEMDASYERLITESSSALHAGPSWPSSHPTHSYVSATFSRGGDLYDIYLWTQFDHLWVEIDPRAPSVFACGAGFTIVQTGLPYSNVKLETISGDSFCDDLSQRQVFLFTQWQFADGADLSSNFRLATNSYRDINYLDVKYKGTETTEPQGVSKGRVYSNLDINIPHIQYDTANGSMDIWADLKFYGTGTNGELLWELYDYGIK